MRQPEVLIRCPAVTAAKMKTTISLRFVIAATRRYLAAATVEMFVADPKLNEVGIVGQNCEYTAVFHPRTDRGKSLIPEI